MCFKIPTATQIGVPPIHGLFEWLCPATTEIIAVGPSHGNNCIIFNRYLHNARAEVMTTGNLLLVKRSFLASTLET